MSEAFRPVVVAPTFNNAGTVEGVLERVCALGLPVIAVNDGSTDGTGAILEAWRSRHAGATVVAHGRNRGKAAALRTGFARARELGFTHAATMDTDDQLDPASLPAMLELARTNPHALVLGKRESVIAGQPARSRWGRKASNMAIWCESGVQVEDSQCGQRVYPLGLLAAVRCGAARYAFEAEIITRAGWAGCEIIETPVPCRYEAGRVSHFKPLRDTLHGIAVHTRLILRALAPWPRHPRWPPVPDVPPVRVPLWRKVLVWFSPLAIWRQACDRRIGRARSSIAFAVGAFVAALPWGIHTILAVYLARRLHLHPIPVIAGTLLATPPLGVVLALGAIGVGHWMFNGVWPELANYNPASHGLLRVFRDVGIEWTVGGIIVGLGLALVSFPVMMVLLRAAPAARAGDQR